MSDAEFERHLATLPGRAPAQAWKQTAADWDIMNAAQIRLCGIPMDPATRP